RQALAGFLVLPDTTNMRGRFLIGQGAALPLALLVVAITLATGTDGMLRLLLFTVALIIYMYVGLIIPRKPLVAAQQRAQRLRLLVPSFISYVRVSIEGYDAPRALLERYVERPNPRKADMQEVVRDALRLQGLRRLTPFVALREVAHDRGCQELRDVAEQLAQAEHDGTNPLESLAAFEKMVEIILRDEFQRMLKRRQLYLMIIAGICLIIGILGTILYVMTRGGTLLF
ncbi:MAG: hypothetical protein RLZZ387_1015, partial [Chloroflexota bacterium]